MDAKIENNNITFMISQRLAEKGWTQAKLAQETGIHAGTISHFCRNFVDRVDLEHLKLMCIALDCDLWDIITTRYAEVLRAERAARRQISIGGRAG